MKKILILSLNYYPKYIGGAEVAIKEIVERQNKNEYEFHMLTLRFDANLPAFEEIHGIKIHRIGFSKKNANISDLKKFPLLLNKYIYQFFAPLYFYKLHKKENFDSIWAMMAHSCAIPAGIIKTFFPKVKYILTLQEGDPPEYIEKLARPVWPFFVLGFKKADLVQTISTFLEKWATKMGNKNFHTVIPNGVDIAKFAKEYSKEEIDSIKEILGRKDNQTWLITTSRLVHKNAIDDVIRSIKLLGSNFHFAILGIGPDESKLKKLSTDLGVADQMHFLGQVSHSDMPKYLKACDIFIRASRSEGMGNSFVEAFATKLPVIATTEGGLSDLIFDGKSAWRVDPDSPEQIKEQVKNILSDENKRNQIINYSFDMANEKFSWDLVGKRMADEVFSKI